MQTRTICCKMIPTIEAEEALKETSHLFADACNYVFSQALVNKGSVTLIL